MFCTNCGSEIKEGALFCTHCGAPQGAGVQGTQQAAGGQGAQPVQMTPQQPVQPQVQPAGQQATQQPYVQQPQQAQQPYAQQLQPKKQKAPQQPKPPKQPKAPKPPKEEKEGGAGRTVVIILVVLIVIAILCLAAFFIWRTFFPDATLPSGAAFGGQSGRVESIADGEDGDREETDKDDTEQDADTEDETVAAPQEITVTFVDAITGEAARGVTAYLTKGHNGTDYPDADKVTVDADGKITGDYEDGDYTLSWKADAYQDGHRNVTVANGGFTCKQALLPKVTDASAYIYLEWDGTSDLDLCLFNAATGQYVSAVSASDSTGNFIYEDRDGTDGYEVIRIPDYGKSDAVTIYVRDNDVMTPVVNGTASADAKAPASSTMEQDGVRIKIYTSGGNVTICNAETAQTAGVWNPGYVYQGRFYENNTYLYGRSDYNWAVYDKQDASTYNQTPVRMANAAREEETVRFAYALYMALPAGDYKDADAITAIFDSDPKRMGLFLYYFYHGQGTQKYENGPGGVQYEMWVINVDTMNATLSALLNWEYDVTKLPDTLDATGRGARYKDNELVIYQTPRGVEGMAELIGYADYTTRTDMGVKEMVAAGNGTKENGRIYLRMKNCNGSYGFDVIGCEVIK